MGRLATGHAFYDREEVMLRAWDLLKTSNLLLLAPRRVGKSSLLNRMNEESGPRGYQGVYLSVPDAEDELDFIKRMVRGFQDAPWSSGGWAHAFREHVPKDLEVVLKTGLLELKAKNFDWRRPADDLEAILKAGSPQTLILIDELPLLIGSIVKQDPGGSRPSGSSFGSNDFGSNTPLAGSSPAPSDWTHLPADLSYRAPFTIFSRWNSEPSASRKLAPI